MSCDGDGGTRHAGSLLASRPPFCAALLFLLMASVSLVAPLSLKIPPIPQTKNWFYNGTYASPWCETTFRCDTSGRNNTLPTCSCHPNCSLYDACCEDVRPNNWRQRALPPDAYECAVYPILNSDVNGYMKLTAAGFVFLITKCPSSYRVSAIAKLCAENRNDVRLTNESVKGRWVTENTTGVTYSNQFCALCNGVPVNRMVFWNFCNVCISDPSVEKFGLTGCNFNVLSVEYNNLIPKCTGPYRSSCLKGSSPQMQEACTSNPAKYIYDYGNFQTYRNYNCSLCNSLGASSNFKCNVYPTNLLTTIDVDLQALLVFDSCPKNIHTFVSKDDQVSFNQLCPKTVFDTENCTDTVNRTTLLASYDGSQEYSITSEGVRLWLNDTYSMCYACQPSITFNYTLTSDNVIQLAGNETYPLPLYHIEDSGAVTICSVPNSIEDWLLQPPCSALPAVVDVVLMSLSLFGLAMYAVAYAVLPSLRNLPGQIVLHQSAAFFAAFLLWLFRPLAAPIIAACIALGVLIHFFFLAAFTWTTVYAFEVVRALGFQAYGAGYTKRRLRYTLAGWLVPLVITVIAIIVNWVPGDFQYIYRPAYGQPQCFINNWVSQRIFFTAPLAAFLLLDVIIYAYVIVQLVVISGQTKLVRESHHEKLLLAVKLVFALGITWIFAVLASATENCELTYIFRVLNSLQGVFLFLIFICNAKTSGQIHQKVRGQKSLTSGIVTGGTVSSRDSSSSTTSILSKRKSILGVKSFSPVSLAMDAREHASKPPPR